MEQYGNVLQYILTNELSMAAMLQLIILGLFTYLYGKGKKCTDRNAELLKEGNLIYMKMQYINLGLSIITATALRDGKTNGTLQAALDSAEGVKAEYIDYLAKFSISHKRN